MGHPVLVALLTAAQTLERALSSHVEAPGAVEGGLAPDPPALQTALQGQRRRGDQEVRALHV